jgi:3-oxoadipate CoA-transferase, beta subunit
MMGLRRQALARLVASQLPRDSFVNLGIGAPTLIGDHMPANAGVILHSENGVLHIGPAPENGSENLDLINAGKAPITLLPGGSFFDSSLAFGMMRGGHLDLAVLGAFQVSERGDLANWSTGLDEGEPPGIGGAIDLAVGAKAIWVMMDHVTRDGAPRIVQTCTLPLTAAAVVKRVFTNRAAIEVRPEGLLVTAVLEGDTLEAVQSATGARLSRAQHLGVITLDGELTP